MNTNTEKKSIKNDTSTRKALIIAVIAILVLVVGFHLIFPLLGIAIAVTAGAWGVIIATIVVFSVGLMLFFIFPGIIILLFCLFAFVWVLLSVILFPFVFPLFVPLLVILLFIAYVRRKKLQQ